MRERLLSVGLSGEEDLVVARQRAELIASEMGFGGQDRVRVATAVSEIARNVLVYAGSGKIEFWLDRENGAQALEVVVSDEGRGIGDLQKILDGDYESSSGMGVGIVGSRRLMHELDIDSGEGGTTVTMRRYLPHDSERLDRTDLDRITGELLRTQPHSPVEEIRRQNQELMTILDREREARELAETATKARDDFFATLSHELRTPLTAILGWVEVLKLSPELQDGPDGKALNAIASSGKALRQLIDQLLDVSRIMMGKFELEVFETDLATVLTEAVTIVEPAAADAYVRIELEVPEETRLSHLDDQRMLQVCWNLLTNAIKFSPEQSVVRAILGYRGDTAEIRVEDEGEGIPADMLETIFGRSEQVISGAKGGMGIGLALVEQIVVAHGGTVRACSDGPGKGATFIVRLPLV